MGDANRRHQNHNPPPLRHPGPDKPTSDRAAARRKRDAAAGTGDGGQGPGRRKSWWVGGFLIYLFFYIWSEPPYILYSDDSLMIWYKDSIWSIRFNLRSTLSRLNENWLERDLTFIFLILILFFSLGLLYIYICLWFVLIGGKFWSWQLITCITGLGSS